MIGKLDFIQCAGSLTTAEYPLIASDDEMDAYVKKTYSNVHFVEDTEQTITMPSFDGWADCNLVRFVKDDKTWTAYYWITTANRSSDVSGANVYTLMLNAPMTLLKKGDTVTGDWLRSPVNYTPWKQQQVVSGTMSYNGIKDATISVTTDIIGDMMPNILGYQSAWVSLTTSKDPTGKQGTYEIYGFPIRYGSLYGSTGHVDGPDGTQYPSLGDIFQGDTLTKMGFTTAEILDISMTPFAPYDYDVTDGVFTVLSLAGNKLTPTKVKYNDGTAEVESDCVMYNITDDSWMQYQVSQHVKEGYVVLSKLERTCGAVNIIKGDGTILKNIPTSWAEDGYIYYQSQIVPEFNQMTIIMKIVDDTRTYIKDVFTITCNHIPYIGSQWDSYRAYSMSYDREAMEYGIDQARNAMFVNMALSAVDTSADALTSAMMLNANPNATAYDRTANSLGNINQGTHLITSMVSEAYGFYQKASAARFNQKLKERQTQAQPGNAVNTGYGIAQSFMDMLRPMKFIVSIPEQLTYETFNKFIEDYGYSNEGRYTMTMQYGFYQGTIRSSPTMTGPRFNQLINDFNNGIRLIPPTGTQ